MEKYKRIRAFTIYKSEPFNKSLITLFDYFVLQSLNIIHGFIPFIYWITMFILITC